MVRMSTMLLSVALLLLVAGIAIGYAVGDPFGVSMLLGVPASPASSLSFVLQFVGGFFFIVWLKIRSRW